MIECVVIGAGFVIVAAIAFIVGVIVGAKCVNKVTLDMLHKEYHVIKK
jgi:hypothetical protein